MDEDGQEHPYPGIRFRRPPLDGHQEQHMVAPGERLDHIAQRFMADPTQWWRIADANAALWPGDLAGEGRRLHIPRGGR